MRILKEESAERQGLLRGYRMLAEELGHVMAATVLYKGIISIQGQDSLQTFFRKHGKALPVLSAMIAEGLSAEQIQRNINNVTYNVSHLLKNKQVIVCVGCEAAWLDCVTKLYPDRKFFVIPHTQDLATERFLANYGSNVCVYNEIDLRLLSGSASVIVVFAFDVTFSTFHTYPIACRIVGSDTRQLFSELIALDLLGCGIPYFPYDFVEMGFDEVTEIISPHNKSGRTPKWISRALA